MKRVLPDYFFNLDLISEILKADKWIDGSKDSYADLCKFINAPILDSFEISDEDRMTLNFMEEDLNPKYSICWCSQYVTRDTFLTENQVSFYHYLDISLKPGPDPDKLMTLVHAMSDSEFEAFGIKEATLILGGHRIIKGQYLRYRHPKTDG